MNVSPTMETEEDLLTCLHIKMFHPQQSSRGFYTLLPVGSRSRCPADDSLRLGRDPQTCTFVLVDPKVSRKQLSLQAYRTPQNPELLFTIQNLSQRGRLVVNNTALGHLEKMDLPQRSVVRFGEYEMLVTREPGEAKATFEVDFEVLGVSPSTELSSCAQSLRTPVMDKGHTAEFYCIGPLETDESLM